MEAPRHPLLIDINTAWAMVDLIHEARELYAEQWERVRKYACPES